MKNSSNLHNWFLMKYAANIFIPKAVPTELLYHYFALPTDIPICLFGNTYDDTRANNETAEFTDGHRIITGALVEFTPAQAETERSVYSLHSINPKYAEWLEVQGYEWLENKELEGRKTFT